MIVSILIALFYLLVFLAAKASTIQDAILYVVLGGLSGGLALILANKTKDG